MTRVAAIQLTASHEMDENLRTAQHYLTEAAKKGAKLAVLPENFALMGLNPDQGLNYQEPLGQGKIQTFLSAVAKQNKIWIVGGTLPVESFNPQKKYGACLVYNDEGRCVGQYNKIHLFDVSLSVQESYHESATTAPGSTLVVIPTPFGKLGLAVCYDLRFPELFRCLFNLGAEIIALPAAFTVMTGKAHWEALTRARAIENFCYLIGAAQTGLHSNGRKTFGDSLIIDPWGTILAQKNDPQPGVIYADIDLDHLYKIRKSIPIEVHQKIFFDTSAITT